jgi:hypothetical protein
LQELHYLKGAQFIKQLKLIIYYGEFHLVEGEKDIFSAISETSDDFDHLINAARKAVAHGNRVYILPNPTAIEVLVYKGKKMLVVTRRMAQNPLFLIQFQRKYVK